METKLPCVATRHAAVFVVIAVVASACASPGFSVTPESRVELSGRWFLDRDASDDTVQAVRASIKRRAPVDPRRGGNPGNGNPALPVFPTATLDGLREALPPDDADWLDIRQMRNSLSLDYEGLKKATYQSGQKLTVFDRAGTGILMSGWDRDRFVIYNEYDGAFTLRQSFGIESGSGRLTQIIEIKSRRLKNKVTILRYYDSQQ